MNLMTPFFIGGALALIMDLPLRFLEDRLPAAGRFKRIFSLAVVFSLAAAAAVILLSLVIPQLTASVSSLGKSLPTLWEKFRQQAEVLAERLPLLKAPLGYLSRYDFNSLIQRGIQSLLESPFTVGSTVDVATNVVNAAVDLALGVVLAAYLLARKEQLGREVGLLLDAWLPVPLAGGIREVARLTANTFSAFLSGQCLEAFILGCLFAGFMWLCHFPCVALISVVIGITALVPVFGSFMGCAVGVIVILALEPQKTLWFVVLFLCLQQLEGMCIYPRVVGNKVGLPPLWVLTAVTLGGRLFGVWGMLAFIPVFGVLYAFLREKTHERLKRKNSS